MTVVETPFYLRKASSLLEPGERAALLLFLATSPDVGDVIPETGGIRKVRWAAKGRGKRGGLRVIYYYHSERFPIFLLTVFAKNQKANLTMTERHELKRLAPLLVSTYSGGRYL